MDSWNFFIFSNSSHLKWRAGLSDTILKGTHPCQVWFNSVRGFRGEDLNVNVYDVRRMDGQTPTDAKWWQKLTWPLSRWAQILSDFSSNFNADYWWVINEIVLLFYYEKRFKSGRNSYFCNGSMINISWMKNEIQS